MKKVAQVLEEVLNCPTAPFREKWVLNYIESELQRLKVPYFIDRWQNIIAGVKNPRALKNSRRTALLAHTDHPGFHLLRPLSKTVWTARWFGGAPPRMQGARLAIHHPQLPEQVVKALVISKKFEGALKNEFNLKILGVKRGPRHERVRRGAGDGRRPLQSPTLKLDTSCFGAFDYPGFSKKGPRVLTRAADDLAGVTIILTTLARLKKNEQKTALGVFTRAEEVGFRGTLGLIYNQTLGHGNSVVSLEASRQLEGARIGLGPVIRLGDRRTLFDSFVTARLDKAAEVVKAKNKKAVFQRRIMNGGTCEATAFNLHGTRASGLAIPLGNYHNQRPDGRPGPEFIALRDVETAVDLCVEFFKAAARREDPTLDFINKLKTDFKKDVGYLNQKLSFKVRAPQVRATKSQSRS